MHVDRSMHTSKAIKETQWLPSHMCFSWWDNLTLCFSWWDLHSDQDKGRSDGTGMGWPVHLTGAIFWTACPNWSGSRGAWIWGLQGDHRPDEISWPEGTCMYLYRWANVSSLHNPAKLRHQTLYKSLHIVLCVVLVDYAVLAYCFYPTALKGCWGIVFTHGVRMGGRAAGKSLSGLYLRNCKV